MRANADSAGVEQVRKKNLQPSSAHAFRVRAKKGNDWGEFSDPLPFTTVAEDVKRADAPSLVSADSEAITVSWTAVEGAETYSVEMRAESEGVWTCVTEALKSAAMRKKNLAKNTNYFFRVKPNLDNYIMSLASPAAALQELSAQVAAMVGGMGASLVNARGETISVASLAGKVVAFYCSASWCGPCRQFTPRLSQVWDLGFSMPGGFSSGSGISGSGFRVWVPDEQDGGPSHQREAGLAGDTAPPRHACSPCLEPATQNPQP